MKKIDIPETQVQVLKEFYTNKAKPIWEKFQSFKKQWEEIEPILRQLGISNEFANNPQEQTIFPEKIAEKSGYDIKWSWLKKSEFVLGIKGNLTSLEIIDIIISDFETTMEKKKAINSLPATLSVAAKEGKILRHKKENGEYVYELKK